MYQYLSGLIGLERNQVTFSRGSSENIVQWDVFVHREFAALRGSGEAGVRLRVGSRKTERLPSPRHGKLGLQAPLKNETC